MSDPARYYVSRSGARVSLTEGAPSLADIALGLGRTCRYGGQALAFWPVLLHSLVVADLLPTSLEAAGLLHDMTDCLLGDTPKPLKLPAVVELEARLHERLAVSLGLSPLGAAARRRVKEADVRAFRAEARVLGPRALARELLEAEPSDPNADEIVGAYLGRYSPDDCLWPDGRAVLLFIARVEACLPRDPLSVKDST